MNYLLTQDKLNNFSNELDMLYKYCPETMTRKIKEANIQQAFVLQTALKCTGAGHNILSVGSYEDTASETLRKLNYDITEIDPVLNYDLNTYFNNNRDILFNTIISTSVIEHVENDEEFIDNICKLLKVDGYAIITCDFNNKYISDNLTKPNEDYRLYTEYDLLIRLNSIIESNGCELVQPIDYSGVADFIYNGNLYTFATYVFKKIGLD